MNILDNSLPAETARKLLEIISPRSVLTRVSPVADSHSNYIDLVEARRLDGRIMKAVVKRYAEFGGYDRSEKARREYTALEFALENGIPATGPLFLDEKGTLLGSPGIVTEYVEGSHDLNPDDPNRWAGKMAEMLAKIHSLPCKFPENSFILDADKEATWFLRDNEPPDFMRNYSPGVDLWNAARDLYRNIRPVYRTPVHIDYWPGNIVWNDNRIVAVLDWEGMACGDPVIDVAYARMEISVMGYEAAADTFLREYERISGKKACNLLFWEMAAAAKPIFSPETWDITESPRKDRFDEFVKRALRDFANVREK